LLKNLASIVPVCYKTKLTVAAEPKSFYCLIILIIAVLDYI